MSYTFFFFFTFRAIGFFHCFNFCIHLFFSFNLFVFFILILLFSFLYMFACYVFLGVQVSDQINSPYYYINYFNK